MVTGLKFDHVILYEPLPVENAAVFSSILSITQLVNKYSLSVDRIYFGSDGSVTLYFGDVKASLGVGDNLDEKIMELQYMIPELEGKAGLLEWKIIQKKLIIFHLNWISRFHIKKQSRKTKIYS